MTDQDRLTAVAVEELARRIKGQDDADAEFTAREFMLWLHARGWRPTEAGPLPAWKSPAGTGSKPPARLISELRADLDAKAAAFRETQDGAA